MKRTFGYAQSDMSIILDRGLTMLLILATISMAPLFLLWPLGGLPDGMTGHDVMSATGSLFLAWCIRYLTWGTK